MERYIVTAIEIITQRKFELIIEADEAETAEDIVLSAEINGMKVLASDYNYLPAYQKLRDEILKLGYGLLCNGSRLNAVQSGMMGANDKIYLVENGRPTSNKDIVCLYDYADIDSFPTTSEQAEFIKSWSILPKA